MTLQWLRRTLSGGGGVCDVGELAIKLREPSPHVPRLCPGHLLAAGGKLW